MGYKNPRYRRRSWPGFLSVFRSRAALKICCWHEDKGLAWHITQAVTCLDFLQSRNLNKMLPILQLHLWQFPNCRGAGKWPSAVPQHHAHLVYLCTQVESCSFQDQMMITYHNPFVRSSIPHLSMDSAYNQTIFDSSSSRKTQTAPHSGRHQVHKSRSALLIK